MIQTTHMALASTNFLLFVLNGTPSERYRVLSHLHWIREKIDPDIRFKTITYRKPSVRFLDIVFTYWFYFRVMVLAGRCDRIFIQKRLLPSFVLNRVLHRNRDIVFDFDDAIYDRPLWKARREKKSGKFEYCIQHVHQVIAGNEYLADRAREVNPDARVIVIPTPIDRTKFDGAKPEKREDQPVVIGWLGLSANLFYFQPLREVLKALGEKYGDKVVFKLVSDKFADMDGIRTIEKKWTEAEEPQDIASFDIGLMPLVDDEWSRGKCGWKALMYMAMGVPCVISPVGVNAKIMTHRVEGFFAETPEEWFTAVSTLVDSRDLRNTMGRAGKQKIASEYSLDQYAKLFYETVFVRPSQTILS